jgi:hypothetical protein
VPFAVDLASAFASGFGSTTLSLAFGSLAAEAGCAGAFAEDFGATFAAVAASRDESFVSTTGFVAVAGVADTLPASALAADFAPIDAAGFVCAAESTLAAFVAELGVTALVALVVFGSALRTFGRRDGVPALTSRATVEFVMFVTGRFEAAFVWSFDERALFPASLTSLECADFESETLREFPRAEGAFAIDR